MNRFLPFFLTGNDDDDTTDCEKIFLICVDETVFSFLFFRDSSADIGPQTTNTYDSSKH